MLRAYFCWRVSSVPWLRPGFISVNFDNFLINGMIIQCLQSVINCFNSLETNGDILRASMKIC